MADMQKWGLSVSKATDVTFVKWCKKIDLGSIREVVL